MTRESVSKRFTVCAAALGLLIAMASTANATLIVDLRFKAGTVGVSADLSTVANPNLNTTYSVEVWVKVIGANTDSADEGLNYIYGRVLSQQLSGGKLGANAGVLATNNFTKEVPFNGPGTQGGVRADYNLDGIFDLGNPNSEVQMIKPSTAAYYVDVNMNSVPCPMFNPAYTDPSGIYQLGDEGVGNLNLNLKYHDITNGTEFLVGTVKITSGTAAFGSGQTTFSWVRPDWPVNPAYQLSAPDNAWPKFNGETQAADADNSHYTVGTSVAFGETVIPEPASIALLASGGVGLLLVWRRRKS